MFLVFDLKNFFLIKKSKACLREKKGTIFKSTCSFQSSDYYYYYWQILCNIVGAYLLFTLGSVVLPATSWLLEVFVFPCDI